MKHLLLIISLIFFHTSFSQKLYGSFSSGYQYVFDQDQPPSYIINWFHQISSPGFWKKEDPSFKHVSNTGVGLGYEINEKFGFELTGFYLRSKLVQHRTPNTTRTFRGDFWRVTPSFKLSASNEKLDVYTRIGLSVIGGQIMYSLKYEGYDSANSFEEIKLDYEFTGPASLGFNATLGAKKEINEHIGVFAEIQFLYQGFSPKKGYTNRYEYNGEDHLTLYDYQIGDTEIDFGEEQVFSVYQTQEENVPDKLYRRTYFLSGIAFNIGVRFNLWSKNKDE